MQWFVQIWNSLDIVQADAAVSDAANYRYEVAQSMMLAPTTQSVEIAEILLKVFDWTDRDEFSAYLLLVYIERLTLKDVTSERVQKLLFEILKRLQNMRA